MPPPFAVLRVLLLNVFETTRHSAKVPVLR